MSLKASHDLKGLQSRLQTAVSEEEQAAAEVKDAQRRVSSARNLQNNLRQQIANLEAKSREPIVTEHALLRYIERVYKIDLNEIRDEILTDSVKGFIEQFGSGKIPTEHCRLVVKDRTVITVETKD